MLLRKVCSLISKAILVFFVLINISIAEEIVLKVGDTVPAFKLPYATQEKVDFDGISSEDLKGSRYVLAFYPADWSGGCTTEMCNFRDSITAFTKLGVEVYPVSGDYIFSHQAWAQHHNLPFKLLGDHTREFGKKMGVYMPDNGMMSRSVFVVGPDGKFEYINYEYSVKDGKDFEELKKALEKSE